MQEERVVSDATGQKELEVWGWRKASLETG